MAKKRTYGGTISPSKKFSKKSRTTTRAYPQARYPQRARVPRTLVNTGSTGLPMRLQNTMKYAEIVQLTIGGSGTVAYVFSANGLYDPNITGTGHQPHYFDQLSALYNHYCVTKATIVLKIHEKSTAGGVTYGIFIDDDSSPALSTQNDAIEREGCVWSTFQYSVNNPKDLYKSFDASKMFGPNVMNGANYIGTAAANPAEQAMFIIWASGTITDSVYVSVEIKYTVTWDELKSVGQS